LFITPVI